jgi:hypothetical protein
MECESTTVKRPSLQSHLHAIRQRNPRAPAVATESGCQGQRAVSVAVDRRVNIDVGAMTCATIRCLCLGRRQRNPVCPITHRGMCECCGACGCKPRHACHFHSAKSNRKLLVACRGGAPCSKTRATTPPERTASQIDFSGHVTRANDWWLTT